MPLDFDMLAPVERSEHFSRKSNHICWYSHKANTLWIDTNVAPEELNDIARHELSHFLLHCSTPYGHLLDELNMLQLNLSLSVVLEYPHELYYPVYDFARCALKKKNEPLAKEPWVSFAEMAHRYVVPWSRMVYLERILEGENLPSMRNAVEKDVLPLINQFELNMHEILLEEELFFDVATVSLENKSKVIPIDPYGKSPAYACPSGFYGKDYRDYPRGANHVYEGLAQLIESANSIKAVANTVHAHEYLSLYVATTVRFGLDRINSAEDFMRVHSSFIALCDLALFIPLGALYGRLRPKITTWLDLQPAYRFLRALEYVAEEDLWISDIPNEMKSFHEKICLQLGWAIPTKFLELGAQLRKENFTRHRDACQIRLERYDAFLDFDEMEITTPLIKNHLPIVYLPTQPTTIIDTNPTRSLSLIIDYFFAHLFWDLMTGETINKDQLLPPYVDYSQLWDNIVCKEDIFDVILEGIPQLSLSRFHPLTSLQFQV